jgi:imidazolonepropionase-like amidohydrolase
MGRPAKGFNRSIGAATLGLALTATLAAAQSVAIVGAGKFVIPGLMDANGHLVVDVGVVNLIRYEDRYGDLAVEAAQIALRRGLTTVFDRLLTADSTVTPGVR